MAATASRVRRVSPKFALSIENCAQEYTGARKDSCADVIDMTLWEIEGRVNGSTAFPGQVRMEHNYGTTMRPRREHMPAARRLPVGNS